MWSSDSLSGNRAVFNSPPYSPWVKGKAARPMDYVRQRSWRGYQYTTLERSNLDTLNCLAAANQRGHSIHGQSVEKR